MPRRPTPLDPDDGPLAQFALALRQLRVEAGFEAKTVDAIAAANNMPRSTLYAALRGERLPSVPVLAALVRAWGGDEVHWLTRRMETETEIERRRLAALREQARENVHCLIARDENVRQDIRRMQTRPDPGLVEHVLEDLRRADVASDPELVERVLEQLRRADVASDPELVERVLELLRRAGVLSGLLVGEEQAESTGGVAELKAAAFAERYANEQADDHFPRWAWRDQHEFWRTQVQSYMRRSAQEELLPYLVHERHSPAMWGALRELAGAPSVRQIAAATNLSQGAVSLVLRGRQRGMTGTRARSVAEYLLSLINQADPQNPPSGEVPAE
ncbi:helix-turn-helix domain-containing protein [Streptomyces sp. enrichment culture]|uniref:helix-turn-helix domain-containing protein n=1 Tax=Streptomyces sp. enrichment culture TaxID=1795815 RepID=UPI003F548D79